MTTYTGTVLDMQRKAKLGADPERLTEAPVTVELGIEGDARGKVANAQITLVSKEDWAAAMADLSPTREVPWTARRANVFVDGMVFNNTVGARVTIGDVELEVMSETDPCEIMNKAYPGLKDALTPDWRAGCRCKVLKGGTLHVGDPVTMIQD